MLKEAKNRMLSNEGEIWQEGRHRRNHR